MVSGKGVQVCFKLSELLVTLDLQLKIWQRVLQQKDIDTLQSSRIEAVKLQHSFCR